MREPRCGFDVAAFGVRCRFAAESMLLLERMKECAPWSGCECRAASTEIVASVEFTLVRSGDRYRLRRDGAVVVDGAELEDVLEQLAREAMVHVADHAPDRVFVHAGVVAWQGRALLLPGKSFAGKSTLVAALVRAGAAYYSDEYAVIDASGLVHPFARTLQMREPGSVEQRPVAVRELLGSEGVVALPVSHIVFTEFVEAREWSSAAMSPGKAVLAMMEHSIAVQRAPARVMSTLAKMMETAKAFQSERGDAEPTAAILLAMMSAESGG